MHTHNSESQIWFATAQMDIDLGIPLHMPRQNHHAEGMRHALLHVLLLLAAEQATIYSAEVHRDVVRTFLHDSWLRKIFKQPRMAVITAHVGRGNSVILAAPLPILQEEWEGKKKSVWSTHQRSGTQILLSPPFFHRSRNGTNSQCGPQENCINTGTRDDYNAIKGGQCFTVEN